MTPADFARQALQLAAELAEAMRVHAAEVARQQDDDDGQDDGGEEFHVCPPKLRAGMHAMIVMRTVRDLHGTAADAARTYTTQRHLKGPGSYVHTADHVLTWAPDLADDVAAGRLRLGMAALEADRRQHAYSQARDPLTPEERARVQAEVTSRNGPAERAAFL